MKFTKVAVALAVAAAVTQVCADEIDVKPRLSTQNFVRESKPTPKATTQTLACALPGVLPAGPPAGAVSTSFNGAWSSQGIDAYTVTMWREPCANDASQTTLYLRIVPTKGVPFICSSGITVVAGGNQYDGKIVQTSASSSFCGDLFVGTTFAMDQWSFNPQYDRNLALTLIFEGVSDYYSGNLRAYAGGGPGSVIRFSAQVPINKWQAAEDVFAAIVVGQWALAQQRYESNPTAVSDAMGAVQYVAHGEKLTKGSVDVENRNQLRTSAWSDRSSSPPAP